MTEKEIKSIAKQLRKPAGELATIVGEKMNVGNHWINLNSIETVVSCPGKKVLEIGMGNGFFTKNLFDLDESINYFGCDYSEEMVAEAGKYNQTLIAENKADFKLANVENLPIKDESIDKAFTIKTLYFWDNPKMVLKELRRVLVIKGHLVIAIRPKDVMANFSTTKYGFEVYDVSKLKSLLESNGFKVTNVQEIDKGKKYFFEQVTKDKFVIVTAHC
jgi:ubiquinone/menaquinone biosynthesis C-methylase UbiE